MDRIDRIKKEMMNAEGGMRNDERQAAFHSSFLIPPSAFLLSCLSCPSCLNPL
jgi:hypothetical protein